MYHFVFQNRKHRMNRHDPRRTVPHSTRGNFDLDFLRRTLGEDHTVFGCGQHPMQKFLNLDHRTSDLLMGHVIEVAEKKTAMWIRLNHEQFCRDGVKLTEFYQDLDITWLEQAMDQVRELNRLSTQQRNTQSQLNNVISQLRRVENTADETIREIAIADGTRYLELQCGVKDLYNGTMDRNESLLADIRQHFVDHQTLVKSG